MKNSIVELSKKHLNEVQDINIALTEKSLRMRYMAYIADVKTKLLTNTIYNMSESKQILKTANNNLSDTIEEMKRMRETIDEQKDTLHNKNKQLEALSQEKSTFIGTMSHELRTPLNAIICLSDILERESDGTLNENQKKKIGMISDAGNHLLALITDIIELSRIETYKVTPQFEKFDVYTIVQKCVNLLKNQIAEKGLTLKCDAVHIDIQSDKQKLTQCLLNLISNALKYSESGTISINSHLSNSEPGMLEISVSDTGIGIKEKDIPLLFSMFMRLNSPLKSKVTGTGLGLHLTKQLVRGVLGGDVSVSSVYGKGSTFKLNIPTSIN